MYQRKAGNQNFEFGTSGLLYQSSKLMYDHQTKSLWSTLQGKPVVGPLVSQGIRLERLPVVTTTWKKWKTQHPTTSVLSLETGHERDYGEGVAYRDYFATDQLKYSVGTIDDRLKNKAPVLALRQSKDALAISVDFLRQHQVYHGTVGTRDFVVLSDDAGTCRVFESKDETFLSWNGTDQATDKAGRHWKVAEEKLTSSTGDHLNRIPAHRVFWFGWVNQFPQTRLVH